MSGSDIFADGKAATSRDYLGGDPQAPWAVESAEEDKSLTDGTVNKYSRVIVPSKPFS
ncbi:hypothetical protein NC651_012919 [Populus alba x Populus x berolinensis]|nr:hypothetical protein NC651_012919 [Populus alba x Populus x berolinensis]